MNKRICPFTDFGFKLIFGSERNKEFTIDFLNGLFSRQPGFSPIVDLDFLDKEADKQHKETRGAIFDIHCRTADGKRFVVEMQNSSQEFFIDRSLYYSSRVMATQARKGLNWNFELMPVYFVALMNFALHDLSEEVLIHAGVCDMKTGKPISDKMRFCYIQLPKFSIQRPEECHTAFDQWIYVLKNMEIMERMPFVSTKEMFKRLDSVVSYAALDEQERSRYDADLKAYRDITNQISYAEKQGLEKGLKKGLEKGLEKGRKEGLEEGLGKGLEQGREETQRRIALNMLGMNLDVAVIAQASGLTPEQIATLRGSLQ